MVLQDNLNTSVQDGPILAFDTPLDRSRNLAHLADNGTSFGQRYFKSATKGAMIASMTYVLGYLIFWAQIDRETYPTVYQILKSDQPGRSYWGFFEVSLPKKKKKKNSLKHFVCILLLLLNAYICTS